MSAPFLSSTSVDAALLLQGLLEGVFPEMDAAIRAASPGGHVSAAGSGRGSAACWGASSSAIGLPLDMGGYDDKCASSSPLLLTEARLTFSLTQLRESGVRRRVRGLWSGIPSGFRSGRLAGQGEGRA